MPVIGITLGDPGSIGPEILLKALSAPRSTFRHVIFGSRRVLKDHARRLGLRMPGSGARIEGPDNVPVPSFGADPPQNGRASMEYVEAAFRAYEEGRIDALVTGPIHKESWHACGYRYPGQTEYCAERTGAKESCMLMAGRSFRIALLSTHYSLREALSLVRREAIHAKLRLLHREFRRLGFLRPRIGCAALNPHAGEGGAFGREEIREIRPALELARAEGILVDGPLAPEVIFRKAEREREWDVVLAMYHDQAMIPLKLIDFEHSANVTLGLPLIRTSPDHGTAFDIAGRGKANPASMRYAIRLAGEWTVRRWKSAEDSDR